MILCFGSRTKCEVKFLDTRNDVAPHASVDKSPANGTRQTGMWWARVETVVASCAWPCPSRRSRTLIITGGLRSLTCKMREPGDHLIPHMPTAFSPLPFSLPRPRPWPRHTQSGRTRGGAVLENGPYSCGSAICAVDAGPGLRLVGGMLPASSDAS